MSPITHTVPERHARFGFNSGLCDRAQRLDSIQGCAELGVAFGFDSGLCRTGRSIRI